MKLSNLATLIGVKNLQNIISDDANTHVVILNDGELSVKENDINVNFANVVGLGNLSKCNSLVEFLNENF